MNKKQFKTHITKNGYLCAENNNGLDVYDRNGKLVCTFKFRSLYTFENDNEEVDDNKLENAIYLSTHFKKDKP